MDSMLEDGELSGSDSEMTPSVRPPPADHCLRAAPPVASGYRSSARPAASSGDSSGEEEDDEPIAAWRCKRQKVSNAAVASQRPPPTAGVVWTEGGFGFLHADWNQAVVPLSQGGMIL
jgi:hypothetical protein